MQNKTQQHSVSCAPPTCTGQKQYTGLLKIIVGVLTTCHTQYT